MNNYIKEDGGCFDGFDFENAKPIKHPLIAKAQAGHKAHLEQKIRCYAVMSGKVIKIGDVPEDIDGEYVYFID